MTDEQGNARAGAGSPGPAATTRLDDAALSKLRELDPDGRRGVVARVLIAFESSLARWLVQLEGQRTQPDPGTVNHIAHTLKSSAGSVGATDLAQACAVLERRLHAREALDLPAETDRLVALGHAALGAVRAMLRA